MISTLGRAAKLGGQRGWKLFAFFAVLLAWYGIADAGTINAVQIVDLAIEVLAASGLVLMAFEIDFLACTVWRGFAGAYFAYYSVWFAEKAFVTEGGPAAVVIENAHTLRCDAVSRFDLQQGLHASCRHEHRRQGKSLS
jgi:hypothetical protein